MYRKQNFCLLFDQNFACKLLLIFQFSAAIFSFKRTSSVVKKRFFLKAFFLPCFFFVFLSFFLFFYM